MVVTFIRELVHLKHCSACRQSGASVATECLYDLTALKWLQSADVVYGGFSLSDWFLDGTRTLHLLDSLLTLWTVCLLYFT